MLPGVHATTLTLVPSGTGMFAGTHGDGIFFSADSGKHWEQRDHGMSSKDVYSLAAVEQGDGITVYAGTQPASLFRSRDLGRSWAELPSMRQVPSAKHWTFPAPPHLAHTKMMVFDPRDPNTFYVAIEQGALLLTNDGGASWRELDSYSRPDDKFRCDVHQVLLLPSSPDTVFMSTGASRLRTTPLSATCVRRHSPGSFFAPAMKREPSSGVINLHRCLMSARLPAGLARS
jgi:hypothetical protein